MMLDLRSINGIDWYKNAISRLKTENPNLGDDEIKKMAYVQRGVRLDVVIGSLVDLKKRNDDYINRKWGTNNE